MRVLEVLEQGIADGPDRCPGVRIAPRGRVVDVAVGDARAGVPMTTDTLMNWFSMTKAVTAVAVAQQWQAGALDVDAPAASTCPSSARTARTA